MMGMSVCSRYGRRSASACLGEPMDSTGSTRSRDTTLMPSSYLLFLSFYVPRSVSTYSRCELSTLQCLSIQSVATSPRPSSSCSEMWVKYSSVFVTCECSVSTSPDQAALVWLKYSSVFVTANNFCCPVEFVGIPVVGRVEKILHGKFAFSSWIRPLHVIIYTRCFKILAILPYRYMCTLLHGKNVFHSIFEFEIKKTAGTNNTLSAPTNLGYQSYYRIFARPKKWSTAFS